MHVWWVIIVILRLRRLIKDNHYKVKTFLGYTARYYHKQACKQTKIHEEEMKQRMERKKKGKQKKRKEKEGETAISMLKPREKLGKISFSSTTQTNISP